MSGSKVSGILIGMGMTGGIAVSATFIQDLNENAPAYGLMITLSVGILGITTHIIIGLLKHREERRHHRAIESKNPPKPE